MRIIGTGAKALIFAMLAAVPSQLAADELPYGNGPYKPFPPMIAPGQLADGNLFDRGTEADLKIIGATIYVQGIKDRNEVVRVLEFTKEGPLQGPALGPKPSQKGQGGPGIFYSPASSPAPCNLSTEPVLAYGQEYQYQIRWCKLAGSSSPKKAKKNYYYLYANGDFRLVLTLHYDCTVSTDFDSMPPVVQTGAC